MDKIYGQTRAMNEKYLQKNNFDILRMVFAFIVFWVHAYELSQFETLSWVPKYLSSRLAVNSFFIVSGFLIFMSAERSTSVKSYSIKRIKRIYPAYITIILLCAFGFYFISDRSLGDYFLSVHWIKYLAANLLFLNFIEPSLPGVFTSHNHVAVNGALWTLKLEVMFYCFVPFCIFLFKRFNRLYVLIGLYILSVLYAYCMAVLEEKTGSRIYAVLGRQLPGRLSYFMGGALFYYYFNFFKAHIRSFLFVAITILCVNTLYKPLPLFEPFALSTVVIFMGLYGYLGKFGKYGDFSYGLYIVHFPLMQLLLTMEIIKISPYLFIISALGFTAIGTFLMWNCVEKRFIKRRE